MNLRTRAVASQRPDGVPALTVASNAGERVVRSAPPPVRRSHIRRWMPRNRIDTTLMMLDFVALSLTALYTTDWCTIAQAAIGVLTLEIGGQYRHRITLSALNDLPRLSGLTIIGAIIVLLVFDPTLSLRVAGVDALTVAALLFVVRLFYYAVVRRRRRTRIESRSRTAIVGGGHVAAKLVENINDYPELGLEGVVLVERNPLPSTTYCDIDIETSNVSLRDAVVANDVKTVIMAFSYSPDSKFVSPLRELDQLDVEIYIVPRLFEFMHMGMDMDRVHTIPLLRVRRDAQRTWYWRVKRVFDATVSALALLVLTPVIALTAATVYLNNRSAPIIFRQYRVGRDEREFTLYKFRSLRPVPETHSDVDWKGNSADRLDALGRFLRRSSLDELPQLWNVLRGDMSLVGPRPERRHFVEQFRTSINAYSDRHRVDVGLTGWAAIHGLRGDTSIEDRAMYDNFYIENWSVWLDIKIIVLTIGAVLRGAGS